MAINFTDSPADGATQVIGGRTYTYNSAKNKWDTTATEVVGPTATVYATVDNLPGTATTGDQAFVSGTNRLYIWNGSGWYNIALINTTPSISGVNSSYALASDGTATVITITAVDAEGLPITYSIASDTSGNIATVTQGTGASSNVFTITPSTSQANAGTFSLTFRASDGVNIASSIASFELAFSVVNSNYTTALITSVGANNAVNNTFVDSSSDNNTVTLYGNVTQNTFSPYRHGGYSTYFDGSSSLSVTNTGSTLGFGTGDVTVEGWINQSLAVGTQYAILADLNVSGVGPVAFWYNGTVGTGAEFRLGAANVTQMIGFRADTPINEWFHFAYVRESGTWKFYLNGTEITTRNTDVGDADGYSFANFNPNVGSFTNGLNMAGYMTDLRVVVGTAVYTSNFTPPTERLTAITNTQLLACHLPYIADGSTNAHSITINGNTSTQPFSPYDYETYSASTNSGSMYFDGSGDYLRADTALDNSTSAGDPMTVETWFRVPSSATLGTSSSFNALWGFNRASDGSNTATLGLTTTGFYWHRDASAISVSNSWARDIWHHIAVVYHDGTNGTAVYLNGQSIYTNSTAHTTAFADCVCGIGAEFDAGNGGTPGNYFPGHMSNFRITHSAVYTSNFTPPTAPLTAITNTSLVLSGTNAGIIDKSQSVQTLTLNGNVSSSTTQNKYLTSSMYFDGTGDYVSVPNETFHFGTEDFTIEFWIYHTSATGYQTPFDNGYTSAGSLLFQTDQNTITYRTYHGSSLQLQESGSPTINTWYHIALVRNGGTMTLYRDGAATATGSYNNNYTYSGPKVAMIGAGDSATGPGYEISGYISDFRVTKGLARYTANFTPPTAELKG